MPHIYTKKLMVTIIALIIAINCKGLVDEQARQARAQQFGNKTANLGELEIIVDSLNADNPFSGIKYAVPAFFGISHDSVVQFLRQIKFPITIIDEGGQKRVFDPPEGKDKTAYDYLMDQWEWFKKKQPLDAPKLMPAAKENLANIRNVIFFALNSRLLTLPLGDQEKLLEFLNRAKAEERLNMVRSTGHEDTKEWANAGGNETISSVIPRIDFITKAIEKVAESYFSEKSFSQRMLAPSKELIHADPFLPGLLQIMIGERSGKGDRIPVSGVIFSQEAEGQTPGVVSINATWGHGEGVVNGLVSTDQYYVGPTGVVHSLISTKKERIKTNDTYQLSLVANPKPAINVPCLTALEVHALAYAARVTQEHYNNDPQDLEFVIQGDTIYLVQTRPIVNMATEPSYLKEDYLTALKEENKKDVFFIGAGGGAVRIIESENELVIADNIRKALDDFLDRPDKQQIKAVAIGTVAPPTSHEATNFRGAEKPVIYMPDMGLIKRWLQENKTVLIDTQRSIIVSFIPTTDIPSPYYAIEQNAWITHPITKKMTITDPCNDTPEKQSGKFEYVMTLLTMGPMSNIHASPEQHIELLKQAQTRTEALRILKSLFLRISQRIIDEKEKQKDLVTQMAETNPTLIEDLERIHFQLRLSACELWSMGEHWFNGCQTPQERIKMLYPIVFLEAAIMQIPHAQEFIDDYSFGSLLKTEKQEEELVQKLKLASQKYRSYYVQLAKAGDDALVEPLTENWHNFMHHFHELSIKDGHQSKCIGIVGEIQQLGLMPLWMNTSFESATKKYGQDYKKIADTLIEEYQDAANELKWCKSMQDKIAAFGRARIDDPKEFASLMRTFAEDIFKPMTNYDFLKKYDSLPELAKLSWLVTAQKFVDVFDGSIKTLERSQLYTDKLSRAERFYEMVGYYFSTLQSWSSIPSLAPLLNKMVDQHTFKTMAEYLEHINQLLTVIKPLMLSERQIQFSRTFNVSASAIGSQALWARSVSPIDSLGLKKIIKCTSDNELITAEDIFSLCHENLKILMTVLLKQTGIMNMNIPELLSISRQSVESISYNNNSPFLLGVTLGASDVVFWYNLPLANHSSIIQVAYNRKNKKYSVSVQFLGRARDRWAEAVQWAYLLTYLTDITFTKEPNLDIIRGLISMSFEIKNGKQSEIVAHYIKFMQQHVSDRSLSMPIIIVSQIVQKPADDVAAKILDLREKNTDILYKKYISTHSSFTFMNLSNRKMQVKSGSTNECYAFFDDFQNLTDYDKYIPVEILFEAIKMYLQSHDIPGEKVLNKITYMITTKLTCTPYWDERMKAQLENLLAFLVDSKFKNVQQQILLLSVIDALVKKNVPSSFGLAKMLMREALQDDNELIKRKGMSLLEHLTGAHVINSAEARNLLEPIVHGKSAALKKTASDLIARL